MIKLRPYQKECLETIYETFKSKDKQLIQLPTGAGKTVIFTSYIKKHSHKSLIICPNVELQGQIYKTCKQLGVDRVFVKNNKSQWKDADTCIATAASLNYEPAQKFFSKIQFDTIIIDEAHRAQSNTYKNFLSSIEYPFKLLGCTATPERLDELSLLSIFETFSFSRSLIDLISQGFLCDIVGYRIKTGCKLRTTHEDFQPAELKILDNETRNKIILDTFLENCRDKKTLIFCLSVDHAEKVASYLKSFGIKAESISGKMSMRAREGIFQRFKSGETQVLTNMQLLTEGFDEPSIEALIIARPTRSKSLYCQMLGRGIRLYPGKKLCYLYELTDNAHSICTFNVAAEKDLPLSTEYNNGIKLTDLYKEIVPLHLQEIMYKKEEYDLFKKDLIIKRSSALPGNSIDLLKSYFQDVSATKNQIDQLNKLGIPYITPITFLEAAFLLWKNKAQKIYGIY